MPDLRSALSELKRKCFRRSPPKIVPRSRSRAGRRSIFACLNFGRSRVKGLGRLRSKLCPFFGRLRAK